MHSNTSVDKAIEYLSQDSISYIDILKPIRRKTADIIYAEKDGVIIYERKSQACMIAMQDLEKCKSAIDFSDYSIYAVHNKEIAQYIEQEYNFAHNFETYQAVYSKKDIVRDDFDSIKVLTKDYLGLVSQHYGGVDDREYIEDLISRKQIWGIFDNGNLAGFIGEHLEGSIGLLEVLPEHRRKGYGYKLQAFLINHYLKLNQVPFCQVKIDNAASLALQRKLGMQISTETTIWVYN